MAITFLSLAVALGCFIWVLAPIFDPPQQISLERSSQDARLAVSKSVQELRTDLDLQKIQQEDLDHITRYLEEESSR